MSTETTRETQVGSYFVSNYPPYSQWQPEYLGEIEAALDEPTAPPLAKEGPGGGGRPAPLGLYLHIPFCRKRCKFCYFRVYTDKNAHDIERYAANLAEEVALVSRRPGVEGRRLRFVYFGGGTPSYLSTKQLRRLVERLHASISWDDAEEVTFECEPGTLSLDKIQTVRELGVTRLSLGIENFDDEILETNGRAHHSAEIYRAYEWIQQVGFPQVNIDLIAGMVGETWDKWRRTVAETRRLAPDSVTVYQMELPYNTTFSKEMLARSGTGSGTGVSPVADWQTKRAWVDYAFRELEADGYTVSSGYTVVKDPPAHPNPLPPPAGEGRVRGGGLARTKFLYRDGLFQGVDLLGTGVASFGHFRGVHYQNVDQWEAYNAMLEDGRLPLGRALRPTEHQLLIRSLVLQLKLGKIESAWFRERFGADILEEFGDAFERLRKRGMLTFDDERVELTRDGLLCVDALLPEFFEPEYRSVRYT